MATMPKQKPGRSKQDYGTPYALLEAVRTRLKIEDFTIDLAASKENTVCDFFYSEEDDALAQTWVYPGWAWCNPPFGTIRPWVKKAHEEASRGAQVAMLVPASFSKWWCEHVEPYAYISFLAGRITFEGETTPYPKDCALLLYSPWGFTGHEIWHWRGCK